MLFERLLNKNFILRSTKRRGLEEPENDLFILLKQKYNEVNEGYEVKTLNKKSSGFDLESASFG